LFYGIYRLLTRLSFILVFPGFLVYAVLTGKHRKGLGQRLGYYRGERLASSGGGPVIWLHASSVGEIKAAEILASRLRAEIPQAALVLTTMTEQGLRVARQQLDHRIDCLLAPLDLPGAVDRAIHRLRPDFYLCLETELWPNMLAALRKRDIPCFLLNARLSDRSFRRYRLLHGFTRQVLGSFTNIAAISEADAERLIALKAAPEKIRVCGNVKYDLEPLAEPERIRRDWQRRLGLAVDTPVLVAGSTHGGEELLLLKVWRELKRGLPGLVLILAPRHLGRLETVGAELAAAGAEFDLLSRVKKNGRQHDLVVVDTMGVLASLYAVATFIFCGGSLVNRGGHNIMEAAAWGRPVLYGPSMKDFADAKTLLEAGGGGFQVADGAELLIRIKELAADPAFYRQAAAGAGQTALSQRGAAAMQLQPVLAAIRRLVANKGNEAGENPGQAK
jgi:3-deoxy-D-manno-octulosonic-acid transferase